MIHLVSSFQHPVADALDKMKKCHRLIFPSISTLKFQLPVVYEPRLTLTLKPIPLCLVCLTDPLIQPIHFLTLLHIWPT